MPQEPIKRDDNKMPRFGNNRPPGDDPNQPKKGPRFSIYWIYAIIFAVLIGFQLFSPFSPNMTKIKSLDFRTMVMNGEVEKYTIIDNRKTVKVFLTKEAQQKYEAKLKTSFSGKKEEGPHMYFKITSGDAFQKEMSDFYKANPTVKEIPAEVDNEKDWFGGALQFLLPILLFVGLWILLMRKMGGGAGGGGGPGGIFNIGKSKATLFDKGTKGEHHLCRCRRTG